MLSISCLSFAGSIMRGSGEDTDVEGQKGRCTRSALVYIHIYIYMYMYPFGGDSIISLRRSP